MTTIEERIIIIVTDAINKMLHQMPEQDLLRGIVHACLSHARGQQRMSLRVHPSQADGIKQELKTLFQNKVSQAFIDVRGDRSLEKYSAILESEVGVIDASLDVQKQALRNAIETMLKCAKQTPTET